MNSEQVREILAMLPGVRRIKESMDGFIHCGCFLAPYSNDHTHDIDRKPSMWISVDKGLSRCDCWTCHPKRGSFVETLEYFNTMSGGKYNHVVAHAKKVEKWISFGRRREVYLPTDHDTDYNSKYGRHTVALPFDFLKSKGIREENTLKQFRIGADPSRGLVTFPIITRGQRVVGAQARSIMGERESGSKYFQLYTDCQKSSHLFGEHLLELELVHYPSGLDVWEFRGKSITVWEGPLDVMHVYEEGLRNAVGIMGSQVSEAQAIMLLRFAGNKPITIVLDPDAAGRHGAIESVNRIFTDAAPEANVRMIVPPKDPKQLSRQELIDMLSGEVTWQKRSLLELLEQDLERPKRRGRPPSKT